MYVLKPNHATICILLDHILPMVAIGLYKPVAIALYPQTYQHYQQGIYLSNYLSMCLFFIGHLESPYFTTARQILGVLVTVA